MIRTLSFYLSRELWKVAGLSLVAFTLVMTVFAIIEPLRKEGLAAGQLASLLAFTVPVMLSLTLPVAALFAATIVYGRFSQDNELTACRASGISTIRLLKPAMVLGGVVTVLSLFLSNFVTPHMLEMAEKSVRANVMGIIRQKFKSQNFVDFRNYLVHADQVEQNGDTLTLRGVVAADLRKSGDHRFLTASTAIVSFEVDQGETFATISLTRPAVSRASTRDIVELASMPLQPLPVPNQVREEPSWYTWDRLLQTLRQPMANREIERELNNIKRRIGNDMLASRIVETINRGQAYDKLTLDDEVYLIRAAGATKSPKETVLLQGGDNGKRPVEIVIRRDGKTRQVIKADKAVVSMSWSVQRGASLANIELQDNVVLGGGEDVQRRTEWEMEPLTVPADINAKTDRLSLEEVYCRPESLTSDMNILKSIKALKESAIPRITNRIKSELHGRIAYGISCFLMVAMGAALGLIFRGGQIISAFTLSVIPASIVIVMVLMGKQMVRNPDVPTILGLISIWSGIVALMVADFLVCAHLARK